MIRGTPIGLIEPDDDRTPVQIQGRFLWRVGNGDNRLQADPTRSVCLNCPAYPESCEQSDMELSRLRRMDRDGELHCMIAYGRLNKLITTEIGEAGEATLARGLSVSAYKNYVRQIRERKA